MWASSLLLSFYESLGNLNFSPQWNCILLLLTLLFDLLYITASYGGEREM